MILYSVIVAFLIAGYVFLIIYIFNFWLQPKGKTNHDPKSSSRKLSIVIPVRNEEKNISACIQSILSNNNFHDISPEIIIIDDFSDDDTVSIIQSFDSAEIQLLHLKHFLGDTRINAYKKAALNYGISRAKGDYIVQLDGDVRVSKNYLNTVVNCIEDSRPDFIAAPVMFNYKNSIFSAFQCLDLAGMMGITLGGIRSGNWYLANGANMIFKKDLISHALNGPASGDDMFGIQQVASHGHSNIQFLQSKDALVHTDHPKSLLPFYQQRIRWATKNKNMTSWKLKALMSIPYLNSVLMIVHLILGIAINPIFILLLIFQLFLKLTVDYLYLKPLSSFFNLEMAMKYFIPSACMHILYLGFIGTMSFAVGQYPWKGRNLS